ncbi:MAG: hypothetical protein CMJ83_17885 [Planctomycetes bacterium]|nr:hypothetical protein [Planctomycetota bacterium]
MSRLPILILLLVLPVSAQVSGTVMDAATGLPKPDARVTLQATTTRDITNGQGEFQLPGVTGTGLVIVAAAKGYYNASTFVNPPATGVVLQLVPVPPMNDPNYQPVDPDNCGVCHPDQFSQWEQSPMALGAVNTWVHDIYDGTGTAGGMGGFVYTRDSVHAAGNPASECAACHEPETWIEQGHVPMSPVGSATPASLHGISCDVCHKVADIDMTRPNFPGIWSGVVEWSRPNPGEQVMYGVLGDTSIHVPGFMEPSYQPQLTAEVCAACHQDKNDPDANGNFEEPNGVISEPTYLEWLASPYADPMSPQAATCVDCHMPSYGATTVAVAFQPPQRDPSTIRSHRIEGTTPEFLEHAVELSITTQLGATSAEVDVTITNQHTGHHVPTGVTVRNMILLVEAWREEGNLELVDTGGQSVHALGGVGDPAQGYYGGLPGKLYAKVNHDASGQGPTFFTDATGITFDNRIAALASDTTHYSFQLPLGGGNFQVRARLVYRRAFRFLVDAKQWTLDGHGNPLADVQAPHFGHLMEERLASFSVPGPPAIAMFGTGCNGLVIGTGGPPRLGQPFTATLDGAPGLAVSFLLQGASNTSWLGVPLPIDLASLGQPGCFVLISPDTSHLAFVDPAGQASLSAVFPTNPAIVGSGAYLQWLVMTPSAPLGFELSNALSFAVQP